MLIEKIAEFQDLSDQEKLDVCIKKAKEIWKSITSFFPLPKEQPPILTHERVSANPTTEKERPPILTHEKIGNPNSSGLEWTFREKALPPNVYGKDYGEYIKKR